MATAAAPKIADKLHDVLERESSIVGLRGIAVTRSRQDAGIGQVEGGVDVGIGDRRHRAGICGVRRRELAHLAGPAGPRVQRPGREAGTARCSRAVRRSAA